MSEQRNAERDRGIIAAATEGPWVRDGGFGVIQGGLPLVLSNSICSYATPNNATLIAEARQALPHWLERAVSAEQRVAELEQLVEQYRDRLAEYEDDRPKPRFKMDHNGNLSRIEDEES